MNRHAVTNEIDSGQTELIVESVQKETGSDLSSLPMTNTPPELAWDENNPLKIWVLGDSMVQFFGETFVSMAEQSPVVDGTSEPRLSSGLSRPDYFDWPARVAQVMNEYDPDVVVLMFGGNGANIRVADNQWLRDSVPPGSTNTAVALVLLWTLLQRMNSAPFCGSVSHLCVGRALTHGCSYSTRCIKSKQTQEILFTTSIFVRSSPTPLVNIPGTFPTQTEKLVDVRLSDGVHLSHWGGVAFGIVAVGNKSS